MLLGPRLGDLERGMPLESRRRHHGDRGLELG